MVWCCNWCRPVSILQLSALSLQCSGGQLFLALEPHWGQGIDQRVRCCRQLASVYNKTYYHTALQNVVRGPIHCVDEMVHWAAVQGQLLLFFFHCSQHLPVNGLNVEKHFLQTPGFLSDLLAVFESHLYRNKRLCLRQSPALCQCLLLISVYMTSLACFSPIFFIDSYLFVVIYLCLHNYVFKMSLFWWPLTASLQRFGFAC